MTPDPRILLHALGTTVRTMRKTRGWTRRDLANRTGISERFLADIETGKANPSLLKLCELANSLGTTTVDLLSAHLTQDGGGRSRVIALLGLRGAGKSSVGHAVATTLGCPLIELDAEIEAATGLETGQIFQTYDETFYRRAERDTLRMLLANRPRPFVLTTGGGIVHERGTFDLLRSQTRTVWLKATPRDHWERVIAQGDTRPMADDDSAFAALCTILGEREHLYQQAEFTVDTSGRTVDEVVEEVNRLFGVLPENDTHQVVES
ncbi:MAG: helix-turn-helix domain-containing protein [Planctomycetes bacterium]|nr:helix-turn-helix domain-containing protein [Planctomycetota bacterium]